MSDFLSLLQDHQQTMQQLSTMQADVEAAGLLMVNALKNGHKILLCGNGGSAADAQHIAAEIMGRFETERHALPAIALTTDSSILTAVGNDYGYDHIFSRQIAGLAVAGDVLIAYSTSGNSSNVLQAVSLAQSKNLHVIGLSGNSGGELSRCADVSLCVPASSTARIQEAHAFIGHALCAMIDQAFM